MTHKKNTPEKDNPKKIPDAEEVGVSESVCKRLDRIIGASDLQSG